MYYDKTTNRWIFCGLSQLNPDCYQNLVLLLESPHKDEYSNFSVPLRPAKGLTGTKINNKFGMKINQNQGQCAKFKNKSIIYKVFLVNAIQYQTSCYNTLSKLNGYQQNWRVIRNCVFKKMWENQPSNLQQNLNDRITSINPSVLINCVTGGKNKYGLKNLVSQGLKRTPDFSLSHPSSW